jgi:cytochrome P450
VKQYRLPPGPRGLPFIGSTAAYRKDRLGFLTQVYRDYGPTTTIRFGSTPGVMVTRPAALRELCVLKASKFSKGEFSDNRFLFSGDTLRLHRGEDKKNFRGCCGCGQEKSMMSMDGDMYESQRTIVGEAFHGPAIERYRGIMASLTQRMLDAWTPGQEIELTAEMQKLSASVVFQTLFGVDVQDRSEAVVKAYSGVLKHSGKLFRMFKSDSDIRKETAWTNLMAVVDEIVEQTAARPRDNKGPLLVDMILRGAPANRTNDVIRDQITAFLGAGQVTVAGALIWVVSLLMQHPKVLAKVTQEVQTVLAGAAPAITDLPHMVLLGLDH